MLRRWTLGIFLGGALSAHASEGVAYDLDPGLSCPSPGQLRSAIEAGTAELESSSEERDWFDRRTLRVRVGQAHTLHVELVDPRLQVTLQRSIPSGSCENQAQAVALLLRSWLEAADRDSEPAPSPSRVVLAVKQDAPQPRAPVARSRMASEPVSWEPRVSGGGLLASTAAPVGGSIEGSLQLYLTRRWGVALHAAWFTPLRASDPGSPGSVELRRYALGADASWSGWPLPRAMDLAVGLQDEIDQTEPSDFPQENRAVTHTPQLHVAVRYRWTLVWQLFVFAEGSGTVGLWPRRFLADDPSGERQLLAVPEVQLALDLGLGWHFL